MNQVTLNLSAYSIQEWELIAKFISELAALQKTQEAQLNASLGFVSGAGQYQSAPLTRVQVDGVTHG